MKLIESKHILGASQIEINDDKIGRMGYSGDFGEDIDDYIDVDLLVMDSSYSGKHNNRKWSMEYAMESLVDDIKQNLGKKDINLVAMRVYCKKFSIIWIYGMNILT